MNISNTDPRLVVPSYIGKPDVRFFDIDEFPFKIYGVSRFGDGYLRVDPSVAARLNSRAKKFNSATAGGRVRFKTDSPYVAVRVHIGEIYRVPMLTLTASAGLDLYEGKKFLGSFNPPYELQSGGVYEAVINLGEKRWRELTVNMPLYSGINGLFIGISESAEISSAGEYNMPEPIVFYGSSITHGACASRPGTTFSARLSRMLDADIVNLGFGAGCRGETELAEYIGGLGAKLLVCAYDHNAPNSQKLSLTHKPFYESLRRVSPDMPMLFVSRPEIEPTEDGEIRRGIIKETVAYAASRGDKNVYYLNGGELLRDFDLTHDLVHPNDLGQDRIAVRLFDEITKILGER